MATEYSIQKMVSDGTLSTIALGIQYLQRNDIYIRIAGEETPQSGSTTGYTWSFIDNTTLRVLPVVPNGIEVVVYRRTDVDAMYNIYSQNAQFDEATIDENNQQLLYIAQEYLEQGIPGAGVDTIEFLRDDGTYSYYRLKRTDGSYTDEFAVPAASNASRVITREAIRRSYAEAGFNLIAGSFQVGFTLVVTNDVALDVATGKAFSGTAGTYPAGTPTSGFVDKSGELLRDKLPDVLGGVFIRQQQAATTFTVGPSGDFTSISDALRSVSSYKHVLASANTGVRIELLAGFTVNEQVILDFINLSFVELYSTVTVPINRLAITASVGGYLPVFCAKNSATLPVINASFDMGWTAGAQDQSVAFLSYGAGSSVSILPGKGCVKAHGFGLLASNGATFNADGTIWDDCAGDGVSVYSGAAGSAKSARADRCYNGFVANGGVLDATSSQARSTRSAGHVARKSGVLNAEFADAQNGITYGFYAAISANLNVTRGNCSGCRFGISAQRTAKVSAEEVIADNCTETNISARRYAEIEAQSCHAVNTTTTPLYCIRANYSGSVIVESGTIGGACTNNICRATTNAEIQATDAIMSGATGTSIAVYADESSNFNGRRMLVDHTLSAGTAVQVLRGSTADITASDILAGGNYGVVSQYCASVSADNAEIHGSGNYSVYATDGGKISITNANVRRNISLDQNTDIVISRGGIIAASGAVGGVNTTANTASASGIIFR